ncbi:uncharacterized protein LOC105218477 [Zeugodacus cucurbitae]|uniref:uncharacterized protein LOC105218477 n=1 Tax=Zeugodacus cucurbitae TaxID=28588 RepID=UPI000596A180|nr:uncharacterized protein LOC105218477 [Zeugodacus cucurbitae]
MCEMLRFLAYLLAICFILSAVRMQILHGAVIWHSGNFQRTQHFAAPPPDLSLPPIYLPEYTPISEEPQE